MGQGEDGKRGGGEEERRGTQDSPVAVDSLPDHPAAAGEAIWSLHSLCPSSGSYLFPFCLLHIPRHKQSGFCLQYFMLRISTFVFSHDAEQHQVLSVSKIHFVDHLFKFLTPLMQLTAKCYL